MNLYYVNNNAQTNGDHEVHVSGCTYIPNDKKYLGSFSNCKDAVAEAKKTYLRADGCYWCSNDCHKR
jgi:hypothetical protein